MRWLTTFVLLLLVAAGIGWLIFGEQLAPRLAGKMVSVSDPSRDALAGLSTDSVQSIELNIPGSEPLTLTKSRGVWTQPGQWAVRQAEANALALTLTTLSPRHAAEETDAAGLERFGLADSQKPIVAKVGTGSKTTTLTFGKPISSGLDAPTYLRVDAQNAVVRLGSGLLAKLSVPPEQYRRKQLFTSGEYLRLDNQDDPSLILGDQVTSVKLENADGGFVLKRTSPTPLPQPGETSVTANRLAASWELADVADSSKNFKPLKDRVEPAKLKTILAGVADLWVTAFITGKTPEQTGLDKPDRSISVTTTDGGTLLLRLGKESRRVTKPPPPAPPFGAPPPPSPEAEVYHYAQLAGNPLVFEIRTDKLNDLFAKVDDLRDPTLARFNSNDVTKLTIALKDKPPVTLTKKRGNKDSDTEDGKQDRWFIGDRLAESSKATELLDQLAKLEAKGKENVVDESDAKKLADLGLDANAGKLTIDTADKDGKNPRSFTILIGKDDTEKKKLALQVAGWPRVNLVADDVMKTIDRPALAYRGRRLFDTADLKLTAITLTQPGGESFALQQSADKKWNLTAPLAVAADDAKAAQIADDLSRLQVTEYLDDAPKPEDLDKKYGVAPAKLSVKLMFNGKEQTLDIGTAPEVKPDYYARLNGAGSVFSIPKATVESLKNGALGLLPLQLWNVNPEKVTGIEVQRGSETYSLAKDGTNWKLNGPFTAPVPYLVAQPMITAAANVKAEKYEALSAASPDKFGFDKPELKLTVSFKEKNGEKEDDVTKTMLIGSKTPDGLGRYAKLASGPNPAVFTLAEQLVKETNKPALDLLDKTLLFQDPARVSKIQIAGLKEQVTLVKNPQGAWTADGQSFTVDALASGGAAMSAAQPRVDKLAGYGAAVKWAEYGLEPPQYTVTTTIAPTPGDAASKAETHTIKIGLPSPTGGRYARIDDGSALAILTVPAGNALTRGSLDFVDRTLFMFEASTLAGFVRSEGKEQLEITPGAATGWNIVKPAKVKADQPLMDELADQLSRLRADKIAAYDTKEAEIYGLDQPFATITLKVGLEKPVDRILNIGSEVEEGSPLGDRYVSVAGSAPVIVGILPGSIAKRLMAAPLQFRDRELAKFPDADRVTMTRGDRTVTFAKVDGTWKMIKPMAGEAESELQEFVDQAAKLRAEELVADAPKDLEPFGLARPEATWTFFSGEKEELKLTIGQRNNEPRAYVQSSKSPLIGLLDPVLTGRVLGEFRKRAVWTGVDAAQMETVAISSGASNFSLRKNGNVWIDFEKGSEPLDNAAVTEFLDALAGLKAVRYVADEKADFKLYGLEPPERVIVLNQKGGVRKILQIGREEGNSHGRHYARVVEGTRSDVFIISEIDAKKLLKDRPEFSAKK